MENFGRPLPNSPNENQQRGTGDISVMAAAALILGIISLVGIFCCVNVLTAPVALAIGILAVVKKLPGMSYSIAGIVLAAISLIVVIVAAVYFAPLYPYAETIPADYQRIEAEQDFVFPAYEQNGTIPQYLLKYNEPPFSEFMEQFDITLYDVMDALLIRYRNGELDSISVQTESTGE